MSDSELVSECLKGKSSAQRTLFQLHSGKMFAICLRYMGNTMEAEEVLQESFIKVFEKKHSVMIGSPEEVAFNEGLISKVQLQRIVEEMKGSSEYRKYLLELTK